MSDITRTTVGDLAIAFLQASGVEHMFGIISIHNLPLTDALARQNKIRFVPTRNEAGAVNMADACARVTGTVGVALTSTGAGVGNACGSLLECTSAGTPLLHLTGNLPMERIDRVTGYTHEAPAQFDLLRGASKAAFRIRRPEDTLGILRQALRVAQTPPMGPVSVEIPIDVQKMSVAVPADLAPVLHPPLPVAPEAVARVADRLRAARRPMLWLGGGARDGSEAARRLAGLGIGIVSSVQGRGIVPDDHPLSLGSFGSQQPSRDFFATCDFMMVVGSKLRSAQTGNYEVALPRPLVMVDADPTAPARNYVPDEFICTDAPGFLAALADALEGPLGIDPGFGADIAATRKASEATLRRTLGPYEVIADAVAAHVPEDFNWVRDITMNNSTWGNRLPALRAPRRSVYALGGGIGQGLAQSIGAAIATPGRKTVAIIGDGGFVLNMGEVATAVQEGADVTILLFNDGGYGIMRNLQDAQCEGRRIAADLTMPQFDLLCQSLAIPHRIVKGAGDFASAFAEMLAVPGPSIVEIDMAAVGDFAERFHGPKGTGHEVRVS